MEKIIPIIVFLSVLLVPLSAQRVLHICRVCQTLSCSSSHCYLANGGDFKDEEICSPQECTPGSFYELYGSPCSRDSNFINCDIGCCITTKYLDYSNSCADKFTDGKKYCGGYVNNGGIAAAISVSVVVFVILVIFGIICAVRICCPKVEERGSQSDTQGSSLAKLNKNSQSIHSKSQKSKDSHVTVTSHKKKKRNLVLKNITIVQPVGKNGNQISTNNTQSTPINNMKLPPSFIQFKNLENTPKEIKKQFKRSKEPQQDLALSKLQSIARLKGTVDEQCC